MSNNLEMEIRNIAAKHFAKLGNKEYKKHGQYNLEEDSVPNSISELYSLGFELAYSNLGRTQDELHLIMVQPNYKMICSLETYDAEKTLCSKKIHVPSQSKDGNNSSYVEYSNVTINQIKTIINGSVECDFVPEITENEIFSSSEINCLISKENIMGITGRLDYDEEERYYNTGLVRGFTFNEIQKAESTSDSQKYSEVVYRLVVNRFVQERIANMPEGFQNIFSNSGRKNSELVKSSF